MNPISGISTEAAHVASSLPSCTVHSGHLALALPPHSQCKMKHFTKSHRLTCVPTFPTALATLLMLAIQGQISMANNIISLFFIKKIKPKTLEGNKGAGLHTHTHTHTHTEGGRERTCLEVFEEMQLT